VSPVLVWACRFAGFTALGLALPALPAPVVPFVLVLVVFAVWALVQNDNKQDELERMTSRD
jgi:hypothetical protein